MCNPFPCHRLSKISKNYQNLKTESGSKQRFSLLQEKVVVQAVCLRTHSVWVFRKSQKILTVSDQHFLSYVKKIQGVGVKLTPARIGLIDRLIEEKINVELTIKILGLYLHPENKIFVKKYLKQKGKILYSNNLKNKK